MRQRERDRVEAQARELCAESAADVAPNLAIIWARTLPQTSYATPVDGYAFYDGPSSAWIFLSEREWALMEHEERADTIAHEVAHVVTDRKLTVRMRPAKGAPAQYVTLVRGHGPEWRRMHRRLRRSALEMEW